MVRAFRSFRIGLVQYWITGPICEAIDCGGLRVRPTVVNSNALRSSASVFWQRICMPDELDPKIAERLASSAIGRLEPTRGQKVVSTREALKQVILEVAQEAYEIGLLADEKRRLGELTRPGSAGRPAWMDIRLDDAESLSTHKIRFKPVALKSLLDAGYRCIGDLRWVPNRELIQFHYVGIKTAQQIRAILRRLDRSG
jgi:hypothetical protein